LKERKIVNYRTYEKRLGYILELIEKKRFISVDAAAKRFDCSTRTVKRMLNHLREKGYGIVYDRKRKIYFIEKS